MMLITTLLSEYILVRLCAVASYVRSYEFKVTTYVIIKMFVAKYNTKQKHLGCKKGEANQKQQLSDYKSIHSYTCD